MTSRTLFFVLVFIFVCTPISVMGKGKSRPAPSEVIADVSYVKRGGVRAIRIDFALPIHYVSHFPVNKGDTLNINLRFDRSEVPDLSQLPLLQSMTPPRSRFIPITEVTYFIENETPRLVIKFSREVKYRISQIKGVSSLVIFLPGTFKAKRNFKSDVKLPPIITSKIKGKVSKSRAEKMYRRGRRALQQGKNRTAVRIFSSLLSIPTHKYSRDSLELLGVARERNGQKAHAKAAYSEYTKKYKKGKDAARVKQRLADLIVSRQKPKKRLKNRRKKNSNERKYQSIFFSTFSQYLDYSETATTAQGKKVRQNVDATRINTALSLNWRIRNGAYDIRSFFYGDYTFDTINGDSNGFQVRSAYTKIKNSMAGINMTIGRQSARTAGVQSSRIDGLLVGYEMTKNIRLNLVGGFPMTSSDRSIVQTNKLFKSASLEFNDLFSSLDISPYIYRQEIDGIENRSAIGMDVRYFHDRGDIFGSYDRDTFFDTTNSVLLRGKFLVSKRSAIQLNYNHRRSPSLALDNALAQMQASTIGELFDLPAGTGANIGRAGSDLSVNELKQIALDRTGEYKLVTLSWSQSFSDVLHFTVDSSYTSFTSRTVTAKENPIDTLLGDAKALKTVTIDQSAQLVTSQSFFRRDSAIISYRRSRAVDYVNSTLSLEYRWPVSKELRMNVRLRFLRREDFKNDTTGRKAKLTERVAPLVKFTYRAGKKLRVFGELGYQNESTESQTAGANTSVEKNISGYIAYTWEL